MRTLERINNRERRDTAVLGGEISVLPGSPKTRQGQRIPPRPLCSSSILGALMRSTSPTPRSPPLPPVGAFLRVPDSCTSVCLSVCPCVRAAVAARGAALRRGPRRLPAAPWEASHAPATTAPLCLFELSLPISSNKVLCKDEQTQRIH